MSITRIESGKRMSQAVAHGNIVFLAGQVAPDPGADVAGQTRQILGEIDRLLAAAGSDKTVVIKPPRQLSLELALEYIEEDEYVEVLFSLPPRAVESGERDSNSSRGISCRKRLGRLLIHCW